MIYLLPAVINSANISFYEDFHLYLYKLNGGNDNRMLAITENK